MSNLWRKLDNTAKIFSLDRKDNNNTFRLSVVLKEQVDPIILKSATLKALEMYPSYGVKIKSGFFWNYLENNENDVIIEEEREIPCKSINFRHNNGYLFKVTYFNNKINVDIFHVLTDGVGATIFFKSILYNYLNLEYNLKTKDEKIVKELEVIQDEYLKCADKSLICKEKYKKAFLIDKKANLLNNKTYHYILDLEKVKEVCKKYGVSITEYLTALYIYAIYKTIYNKSYNKDIVVTIPIDLRKHYNIVSYTNFFTCMNIEGNVVESDISFDELLTHVHKEFHNKLTIDNIKKYLARDVKLGTNVAIRLIPLFIKKQFIKYFGKMVNQSSTTTLSNIGSIKVEEQYKKYIDNILLLVNAGKIQKIKCSICSYENKLTVTINSNLVCNDFENEFYSLLVEHFGTVRLESNNS